MSGDQPPLPFGRTLDEARIDRDAAMARVEDAALPGWADAAYELLTIYAAGHEYLFPPAWLAWAVEHGLELPPEARAAGPVLLRASRTGVLQRTSTFLPSPSSHASPKMLWRSAIYRGHRTGHYCGTRVEDVAA